MTDEKQREIKLMLLGISALIAIGIVIMARTGQQIHDKVASIEATVTAQAK